MNVRAFAAAQLVFFCGHAVIAKAQPSVDTPTEQSPDNLTAYWDQPVPAPHRAFELTLTTSLVAGMGQVPGGGGDSVSETLDQGTSVAVAVAYRASPTWALELGTAYELYDKGPTMAAATSARGAVARVSTTYHFDSSSRTDPWLKGGVGYRWLQQSDSLGTSHEFHGFELTGLAVGLDLRVDPRFAFGPALGADLNLLLWDRSHAATDPRLSIFLYLGVQARVDFSGRLLHAKELATVE